MGKWVSIDKQSIGPKGAFDLELCIRYKSEGVTTSVILYLKNHTLIHSLCHRDANECQKCLVS